jgi:hypothetical protein
MNLRCVLVSVDYSDYLAHTLQYNRHHWSEILVITAERDTRTIDIAKQCDARVFCTNAFWENGAAFNKFKSLEQGLDHFGRHGILVLMDADVLWPKSIPAQWTVRRGELHTPFRRVMTDFKGMIPREQDWFLFQRHHFQVQWTGYTQVFHADDPHLGAAPWHELDWRHAGGGDTVFQKKWPEAMKLRPPFEVMHLGPSECNWGGRSSAFLDGSRPADADRRLVQTREMLRERQLRRQRGEEDIYAHEKL